MNEHRFIRFKKGAVTAKTSSLEILPPTEDAAKLHCFRAFLQIQTLLGNALSPLNWGWKLDPQLTPVRTTLGPAPKQVLDAIFCGCVKGCRKSCGCRKTGLKCSNVCLHCNGISCDNSLVLNTDEWEEEANMDDARATPELSGNEAEEEGEEDKQEKEMEKKREKVVSNYALRPKRRRLF